MHAVAVLLVSRHPSSACAWRQYTTPVCNALLPADEDTSKLIRLVYVQPTGMIDWVLVYVNQRLHGVGSPVNTVTVSLKNLESISHQERVQECRCAIKIDV